MVVVVVVQERILGMHQAGIYGLVHEGRNRPLIQAGQYLCADQDHEGRNLMTSVASQIGRLKILTTTTTKYAPYSDAKYKI